MPKALAERLTAWGFSWGGLRDNRRGEWWLIAQMALILAHLLPATPSPVSLGLHWPLPLRLGGLALFSLGLVLAGQGALNLGASLSPLPEPMPEAALVTSGAYGRCRHPLYQAVILCSLGGHRGPGQPAASGPVAGAYRRAGVQGTAGRGRPLQSPSALRRLSRRNPGDPAGTALAGLAFRLS